MIRTARMRPFARRVATNVALWVFLLTFIVLAVHPIPECVACEYSRPWGRNDSAYSLGSTLLSAWLIIASFVAGFRSVKRNWLVPVSIVMAHLVTQPIAGVALWSLWSNEGPMIVVLGALTGAVSLFLGYFVRIGIGQVRHALHAK
jgi:hypothetical protein